jgi:DNA polymerase delta subunit 2
MDSCERCSAEYEPRYTKFLLPSKNYVVQYNQVYLQRLSQHRATLRKQARIIWNATALPGRTDYKTSPMKEKPLAKDCLPLLDKIIDSESLLEPLPASEKGSESKGQEMAQECVLIGTLYKEMTLRGSVLDEFKETNGISGGVQSLHDIASLDDALVLEDESGRVGLQLSTSNSSSMALKGLRAEALVTGVACAVRGRIDDTSGQFHVSDFLFCNPRVSQGEQTRAQGKGKGLFAEEEAPPETNTQAPLAPGSKYVLLVSGLGLGGNGYDGSSSSTSGRNSTTSSSSSSPLSPQLLVDFISGRIGDIEETTLASKIVRIIIAGNSSESTIASFLDPGHPPPPTPSNNKASSSSARGSKMLDTLLTQALVSCPIDIMPGSTDPANLSLPQQPLHPCLFSHSSRFNTFSRVTNPYEASLDGVVFLGHSGQPVSDIARQTMDSVTELDPAVIMGGEGEEKGQAENKDKEHATHHRPCIDILSDTLQWGHLCPTAPDTLPCYPFTDRDPFVIEQDSLPDVLFAGNQPEFSTATVVSMVGERGQKVTRLVCVPSFAHTGMAVLVDLSKEGHFEATTISFK